MEIALPHVVVRICGPGVGPDLVAALGLLPLEVSEARDGSEARRVAHGRPPVLVVVTDPPDVRAAIGETWGDFPRTPILLVTHDGAASVAVALPPGSGSQLGCIDAIGGGVPIAEVCWHVLEAVSRASRLGSVVDHPIGPCLVEVDDAGLVVSGGPADGVSINGRRVRAGESLLQLIAPPDRPVLARALERMQDHEIRFAPLRLLDLRGGLYSASAAMRRMDAGRCAVILQPLIAGGPMVGRHIHDRDPITGLLTRWAIARTLESLARPGSSGAGAAVLVLKLDNFSAISEYIGHEPTDVVLVRVASVLSRVLPFPAVCSRVMGDSFLACLPGGHSDDGVAAAERLIQGIHEIDLPGFPASFQLRASIGVAALSRGDPDFAVRLADAAANEARSAGGGRVIVATTPSTATVVAELAEAMDLGAWEVWLQPIAVEPGAAPAFHEALGRFGNCRGHVIARPDFFIAGRAQGLLERFDLMMLERVLAMLDEHGAARISVNVSFETFMSANFPASYLERIRALPERASRIILEIPPHGLSMPEVDVSTRLEALAAAGVAVAADDFGSGICRLRYLTQYPLAIVKLDELVTGYVDDDPLQREFVRTVGNVCRARGIMTVAEYTRSAEQWRRLASDGVDCFQGELVGVPVPAAAAFGAAPTAAASP